MQTFLFTDVEGSTRLWERYPAAMSAAIARHERLLRDAVERLGGSVFNTAGDSVCAVFASPNQAVAAAIEGQRALLAEPWDRYAPDLRISVRIAVDAGEVHAAGGNYLGPALNQLHRLMKTGHGGQILCGAVVAEAVSAQPGIELRYLGSHTLRDVSEETRVFQIDAPGLPRTFPRLIVERPPSTRLPYHPATLIGRDTELDRIGTELRERSARVVTLLGPGGVGKTTLAVALARQLDDAFPDGVHFIDLSAVQEGALVVPAIARTLEIEDPLLEPEDALFAGLRTRDLLLVLDNCEQVVEEIARFVTRLMSETETVSVLTTSRTPLRIAAEREERIEPLPLPEQIADAEENPAVQLFSEHARQVNARFSLNDTARPAVVDICRMVDGLPLAIELAAAWVRILDPATLRNRLAEGAPLLRSDARDRPERHRTLTSTIDWSYQLLDPAARSAFGRLAVFQGGIPLDGALAVLQDADRATFIEALEQLDLLVQANLLQPPVQTPDGPRYQMLQTIQEFALSTLAPDERTAASRAHASYFAAMAASAEEHYRGPEAAIWLDRLDANVENLRAAVTWLASSESDNPVASLSLATDLWEYFDVRGRYSEARDSIGMALASAGDAPPAMRAAALAILGHTWLSNYEQAETFYRRSIDELASIPDVEPPFGTLFGLASLAQVRGDYPSAIQLTNELHELATTAGDSGAVAMASQQLGRLEVDAGRPDTAIAYFEESVRCAEEIEHVVVIAWVHTAQGSMHLWQGEDQRAEHLLTQALATFETIGDRLAMAQCQLDLAWIAARRTDRDAAFELLQSAVAEIAENGDCFSTHEALSIGAMVLIALANAPRVALDLLDAADRWRASTGSVLTPARTPWVNALLQEAECLPAASTTIPSPGAPWSLRDAIERLQDTLLDGPKHPVLPLRTARAI